MLWLWYYPTQPPIIGEVCLFFWWDAHLSTQTNKISIYFSLLFIRVKLWSGYEYVSKLVIYSCSDGCVHSFFYFTTERYPLENLEILLIFLRYFKFYIASSYRWLHSIPKRLHIHTHRGRWQDGGSSSSNGAYRYGGKWSLDVLCESTTYLWICVRGMRRKQLVGSCIYTGGVVVSAVMLGVPNTSAGKSTIWERERMSIVKLSPKLKDNCYT